MKPCVKCGGTEFYLRKGRRAGQVSGCKACAIAARHTRYWANPDESRRYLREQRWAHRDKALERCKQWYRANPARAREHSAKWGRENPSRMVAKMLSIPNSEVRAFRVTRPGDCEICHRADNGPKAMALDHCRKTNKMRGLLCGNCNSGVGRFYDSPELLRAAAAYLESAQH